MSHILFLFYGFIRAVIFFWVPKSETEVAMDRLNVILEKKSRLINDILNDRTGEESHKNRLKNLIELTEETKNAMSDNEYILHDFEIKNRKQLVDICDIILTDLNDLSSML